MGGRAGQMDTIMISGRRSAMARVAEPLIFALLLFVIAYFGYALVQGQNGLNTLVNVHDELVALRDDHFSLQAEVDVMRNKTRRISDGYLDLDLLDELARDLLGYVRAGEVIVN